MDSVGVGCGEPFAFVGVSAADAELVSAGSAGEGVTGVVLVVWDGEGSLDADGTFAGVEGAVAPGFEASA